MLSVRVGTLLYIFSIILAGLILVKSNFFERRPGLTQQGCVDISMFTSA